MTNTENTTPVANNKITRRQMLKSVSTATAIAITSPAFGFEEDKEKWVTDPDTTELSGLPLAAVHIERAIAAMAEPGIAGQWQVTIHSGDPEQRWSFRRIDASNHGQLGTYTGGFDDLSFVVKKRKGGFDYWNVEGTGNYAKDCEEGKRLGQEFLTYIGRNPTNANSSLLSSIVNSMFARRSQPRNNWGGHFTGVETAFLNHVNGYAMAASTLLTNDGIPPATKTGYHEQLNAEFDRLLAAERSAAAASLKSGDGFTYDTAHDAMVDVCRRVCEMQTQSLADLRLKARALEWYAFTDGAEPKPLDERLSFQLVQAVINGLSEGAL